MAPQIYISNVSFLLFIIQPVLLGFSWHVCTLTALYWLIPVIQYLLHFPKDSFLGIWDKMVSKWIYRQNMIHKRKMAFVNAYFDVLRLLFWQFFCHKLNVDSSCSSEIFINGDMSLFQVKKLQVLIYSVTIKPDGPTTLFRG